MVSKRVNATEVIPRAFARFRGSEPRKVRGWGKWSMIGIDTV
jgi:hypothetical protein